MDGPEKLRHLRVEGLAKAERYTAPGSGGSKQHEMPPRDRVPHGTGLRDQMEKAEADAEQQSAAAEVSLTGISLVFQLAPEFESALESLEARAQGIELTNVRKEGGSTFATVFIPNGKLQYFKNKFDKYISEDDKKSGKPKNKKFVESIDEIRLAILQSFWTEINLPFPPDAKVVTWEVWLRTGKNYEGTLDIFRTEAEFRGLAVSKRSIRFPDRAVILATGTAEQLRASLIILDIIAELRLAKECPTAFVRMDPAEQAEWTKEALERITPPSAEAVSVCILDTGVNFKQPLLEVALDGEHVLTCFPEGVAADHDGHGTEMAGLALYGELDEVLRSTEPVTLGHRLESVKILPAKGKNHEDLYGAITLEAVARIESVCPDRLRVFCMAVTADNRDRGQPSSWSGELDQICYGEEDSPKRLIFVSGGNTPLATRGGYPEANHTDSIHDPGQAWNIITVGAYTARADIQSAEYDGYQPIAPPGALSPSSTTSMVWDKIWPLKPDVVLEGGNTALSPVNNEPDVIDDLSLLTTGRMRNGRLFSLTGDTSAAAALGSRMGAVIQATYPDYWPETVRALIIHSAEWTGAMTGEFPGETVQDRFNLLRCYGYGVPDLDRALWCAKNSLGLVSQAELQPFDKFGSDVKTRDMHMYALPWPVEELRSLGEEPVTMRVTLSYFIEPSPGRRGWAYAHRYASHGLRFDVKRPTDTVEDFGKRLNRLARDEDEKGPASVKIQDWKLGPNVRVRGSVHSDWWTGTASELADSGHIGIFPVTGWWRERPQFERWARKVRYSLVVSITTPALNVDLYTPVRVMLTTPTTITVE